MDFRSGTGFIVGLSPDCGTFIGPNESHFRQSEKLSKFEKFVEKLSKFVKLKTRRGFRQDVRLSRVNALLKPSNCLRTQSIQAETSPVFICYPLE